MAGGEEARRFAKVKEVVASYAARFTLMGPPGAGQSTKLINQTLVAAHVAIVAEATQLALDAGIDAERIPQALAGGALAGGRANFYDDLRCAARFYAAYDRA